MTFFTFENKRYGTRDPEPQPDLDARFRVVAKIQKESNAPNNPLDHGNMCLVLTIITTMRSYTPHFVPDRRE